MVCWGSSRLIFVVTLLSMVLEMSIALQFWYISSTQEVIVCNHSFLMMLPDLDCSIASWDLKLGWLYRYVMRSAIF